MSFLAASSMGLVSHLTFSLVFFFLPQHGFRITPGPVVQDLSRDANAVDVHGDQHA